MRKLKERRPADFVRAPAADAELLGLWGRIELEEARRRTRARRLRQGALGGVALGALLAAVVLLGSGDREPVASPPPVAAPAVPTPSTGLKSAASDTPQQLALPDGSLLVLSAGTRARVLAMREDEVRVRLERGDVECDVSRLPERRFIVEAGAFEVLVTGTRFTVAAGGEGAFASKVSVSVQRGSVEVREAPDRLLAALGAGQFWASDRAAAAAPVERPAAAVAPPREPADAGATSRRPASAPRAPSTATRPRAAQHGEARPDPRALLARASDSRRAGKPAEAADALEELIRRHPEDERAGYAAFLLGRLQLDGLGNAESAVEAFSFAVAHPGSGFFVEDAEARRVEALGKAGRAAECATARARFLAKYPRAARAASMKGMCHEL